MIKILIIDDELSAINMLKILIEEHIIAHKEIRSCLSAEEALSVIPVFKPTLLMIDIEMPGMNGFDLLNQSVDIGYDVIFTTAYDRYAIKAIRFSALDYLLKPIDIPDLQNAINRHIIRNSDQHKNHSMLVRNLIQNLQTKNSSAFKLALTTIERTYFFYPSDIIRCEGSNNYTYFYFINQSPVIVSKTLKDYEELLTEFGFMRVHKSHLINMQYVTHLDKEGIIKMKDGSDIHISRRRKEEVLKKLLSKRNI